jgi:phosphate transport system permease protein
VIRDYWRRGMSHAIVLLCGAAVLLALVPLALILFYVLKQGLSAISWNFFTHTPAQIGDPAGGMANGIVGSLIVTGLAALCAVPIGILAGVYASEYRGTRFASAVRFGADTLNGVPSIVIGMFAYGVIVIP